MKVVVINGSPRRGGVVSQMLGHVVAALPQDCTVESLTVCDLRVRPCTGCMRCRSLGRVVVGRSSSRASRRRVERASSSVGRPSLGYGTVRTSSSSTVYGSTVVRRLRYGTYVVVVDGGRDGRGRTGYGTVPVGTGVADDGTNGRYGRRS